MACIILLTHQASSCQIGSHLEKKWQDFAHEKLWRRSSLQACRFLQLLGKGGARAYLAVSGGLDVAPYLGSRSTFPGGKLGGTQVQILLPPTLLKTLLPSRVKGLLRNIL